MRVYGSRKFSAEGKHRKPLYKLFAAFLIIAFVFASQPMSSAFAAHIESENDDAWDNKVNNLQSEISILNSLVTQPGRFGDSQDQARYRDKYIATMRAAQALMVNGGAVISVTGNTEDGTTINGNGVGGYYQRNPEKLLALYLHQMRKLREKMGVTNKTDAVNNSTNSGTGTGTDTP